MLAGREVGGWDRAGSLPSSPPTPTKQDPASLPSRWPSGLSVMDSYWRSSAVPGPNLHPPALLADEERRSPERSSAFAYGHSVRKDQGLSREPGWGIIRVAGPFLGAGGTSRLGSSHWGTLGGAPACTLGNILRMFQKFQVYSDLAYELS